MQHFFPSEILSTFAKVFTSGLLLGGIFSGCSAKKDPPAPAKPAPVQLTQEEMMAKWKEYSTPNENHKVLLQLVGTWDHTVEFYMDPSAPPEKSKGKSEIKSVMGGRFVEHTVSGKSMGKPFQGKGVIGYDNANKVYRSIWYDNMGTGLMIGSGSYDAAAKVIRDSGTTSCPMTQGGLAEYRAVTTFKDPKHFSYEFYVQPHGAPAEMRVMNIEYTKRK